MRRQIFEEKSKKAKIFSRGLLDPINKWTVSRGSKVKQKIKLKPEQTYRII